ncbi:unnamed protein product [Rotaria sp. Silwood2]|nr:unnamed protein product [Rotaria sp. Silwood2]CAF4228000.1 unnamed protein product [Rotaria sp. Silwood2]
MMESNDIADNLFKRIDTNRDESIDKNEFRNWVSNTERSTSSPYELITTAISRCNDTISRFDRYNYNDRYQDDLGYSPDKYTSYGSKRWIDDTVINTNSSEETNYYLAKLDMNTYKDTNPKIIRRARSESPVTLEQRILVRYLQPPPLPPPGPLIIKEVRPRQPSPPPPLVIHEYAPPSPSPPPLILRERPPTPPKHIPSETITRTLPPLPVPPRSVIIERFPPPPEKPRDIIIERWIPYEPQPERRTIVEHAPPAIQYPQPSNTIIIHSVAETRILRKYQQLGVTQEDPQAYRARYGSSLLDPETLVRQARKVGVIEDTSPRVLSSSIFTTTRRNAVHFDQSN